MEILFRIRADIKYRVSVWVFLDNSWLH